MIRLLSCEGIEWEDTDILLLYATAWAVLVFEFRASRA